MPNTQKPTYPQKSNGSQLGTPQPPIPKRQEAPLSHDSERKTNKRRYGSQARLQTRHTPFLFENQAKLACYYRATRVPNSRDSHGNGCCRAHAGFLICFIGRHKVTLHFSWAQNVSTISMQRMPCSSEKAIKINEFTHGYDYMHINIWYMHKKPRWWKLEAIHTYIHHTSTAVHTQQLHNTLCRYSDVGHWSETIADFNWEMTKFFLAWCTLWKASGYKMTASSLSGQGREWCWWRVQKVASLQLMGIPSHVVQEGQTERQKKKMPVNEINKEEDGQSCLQ